ncbi:MAG: hypothetical protein AVDCRST_MAG72-2702, partial [uncultured Nocardioidaceae bacterium]
DDQPGHPPRRATRPRPARRSAGCGRRRRPATGRGPAPRLREPAPGADPPSRAGGPADLADARQARHRLRAALGHGVRAPGHEPCARGHRRCARVVRHDRRGSRRQEGAGKRRLDAGRRGPAPEPRGGRARAGDAATPGLTGVEGGREEAEPPAAPSGRPVLRLGPRRDERGGSGVPRLHRAPSGDRDPESSLRAQVPPRDRTRLAGL